MQGRLDITETASTVAATTLLEHSDRATEMPASLAGHQRRLGVLCVLQAVPLYAVPPIHLITRCSRVMSPPTQAIVDWVLAQATLAAVSAGCAPGHGQP